MKSMVGLAVALAMVVGVMAMDGWCGKAADPAADGAVPIQIAPSALVLDGPGVWVTVHADVAYSTVDGDTVTLNGVAAASTFADDCGNLVAKFAQADIEAIVAPPSVTLTLDGQLKDGTAFTGSDTIRVIDRN